MTPQMVAPLVMVPLMALAVWRRARTQFGRQPVRRGRMLARITIFAALGLLIAASGLHAPRLLEGLLGGVLAGAALGLLGLRLTRFERGPDGADFYLPNPWIGGLLMVLLVGRLAWRFMQVMPGSAYAGTAPQLGQSPLTLLVLGLMIGYYLCYFGGLLVHHRRFQRDGAR